MHEALPVWKLSQTSLKKINWERITPVFRGESDLANVDISRIFAVARTEFAKALVSVKRIVRLFVSLVGASLALTIAGIILATAYNHIYGGATLSTVSVIAEIDLFRRITALSRDEAMLELIPARYEIALQMATTPEDKRKILDLFLTETSSMRSA